MLLIVLEHCNSSDFELTFKLKKEHQKNVDVLVKCQFEIFFDKNTFFLAI